MRLIRVSSDTVRHYLGEKKRKRVRLKNRPPKPSIQPRDFFPKDCNLFGAIQSQTPSLLDSYQVNFYSKEFMCPTTEKLGTLSNR